MKNFYETNENYLIIKQYWRQTLYYKEKNKIIKGDKDAGIYLNEKIQIINGIYHRFFEENILEIDDIYPSITKKMDGTYLIGCYKNHIYQVYFDKYGFAEILSEIDNGYRYYKDDLKGDCFYSDSASGYYGIGYIEECENCDIITISNKEQIKKFWRYKDSEFFDYNSNYFIPYD